MKSLTNHRTIFISWTPFGRHTQLLGESLNAQIFYIGKHFKLNGLLWKLLSPIDYLLKTLKSLIIIINTKPQLVVVQNPPSIAPIVIVFYSKIFKFKTIIDSHNGAFEKPWVNIPFHKLSLRKASIVTIHNKILLNKLTSNDSFKGINFKILNSRLSVFPHNIKKEFKEKYFLIISSFAGDEPMEVLLQGIVNFLNTKNGFKFKITGNYKKNLRLYSQYSVIEGIEFLGFVDDTQYDSLVVNAYGIIALSTRNDVQQFALMEAVGAEIPFISNKNLTNKDLFEDKMTLVTLTPYDIEKGIKYFIDHKEIFRLNIVKLKNNLKNKWECDFELLKSELNLLL